MINQPMSTALQISTSPCGSETTKNAKNVPSSKCAILRRNSSIHAIMRHGIEKFNRNGACNEVKICRKNSSFTGCRTEFQQLQILSNRYVRVHIRDEQR
jgi:hypothetical protein